MPKRGYRHTNRSKVASSEFSGLLRDYRVRARMSFDELADKSSLARGTLHNGAYAKYRPFGRPRAESVANALGLGPTEREQFLAAYDALPLSPQMTKKREENRDSIAKNADRAAYTVRGVMLAIERRYPTGSEINRDELLAWLGQDEWRSELKSPRPGEDVPKPVDLPFDASKIEPSHPVPPVTLRVVEAPAADPGMTAEQRLEEEIKRMRDGARKAAEFVEDHDRELAAKGVSLCERCNEFVPKVHLCELLPFDEEDETADDQTDDFG